MEEEDGDTVQVNCVEEEDGDTVEEEITLPRDPGEFIYDENNYI